MGKNKEAILNNVSSQALQLETGAAVAAVTPLLDV